MKYIDLIWDIIFSLKTTIFLLLFFGLVVGTATFIENDFGRETAYAVVYGTKWFEILITLLVINLVGNIIKYKMWKLSKLPAFIFHFSFLFIFIGAGMTRYLGYEGIMHIREGQQENKIYSRDPYLQIEVSDGKKSVKEDRILYMASVQSDFMNFNHFKEKVHINGDRLIVEYKNFIKGVDIDIQEAKNGEPEVLMKVTMGMGSETLVLKEGSHEEFGDIVVLFRYPSDLKKLDKNKKYLFVFVKDGKFYLYPTGKITKMSMADRKITTFDGNKQIPLERRNLYSFGNFRFVVRKALLNAREKVVPLPRTKDVFKAQNILSALYLNLYLNGIKKEVILLGRGGGSAGIPTNVKINKYNVKLVWGAKIIDLPFIIKLKDFIVRKYPGSNKPSSYESDVIVIDPKNNKKFSYKIYMNHPLNYGGFKFFQMSYDPDEKGTVLSVNHDPGMIPTYIGYTLLFLGLILNIFNPKSRFGRTLKSLTGKKKGEEK